MLKKLIFTLAITFSLTSLAEKELEHSQGNEHFKIEHANVPFTLPGIDNGNVYLVLKNLTDKDRYLSNVKSEAAEVSEIHKMKMEEGRMEMRQIRDLKIPANGELVFDEKEYHLMLIGLDKPLKVGNKVEFTLTFKNEEKLSFKADVVEQTLHTGHEHKGHEHKGHEHKGHENTESKD